MITKKSKGSDLKIIKYKDGHDIIMSISKCCTIGIRYWSSSSHIKDNWTSQRFVLFASLIDDKKVDHFWGEKCCCSCPANQMKAIACRRVKDMARGMNGTEMT